MDSVKNFITNNKAVQPDTVRKIAEVLGQKIEDIVDPEEWRIVIGEVKYQNQKIKIEIKNRCILGLKGHYQEAQQKLTEITEHLQNLLNDKTLSITKVEAGSILLIEVF